MHKNLITDSFFTTHIDLQLLIQNFQFKGMHVTLTRVKLYKEGHYAVTSFTLRHPHGSTEVQLLKRYNTHIYAIKTVRLPRALHNYKREIKGKRDDIIAIPKVLL